jgi:hypothetical protein
MQTVLLLHVPNNALAPDGTGAGQARNIHNIFVEIMMEEER